ncbi:UV-B-induced protein, chloroplastic-like [Heracleum sosnowskyi]|uniref:UV-B-induced protein, chloroplastic-like n=1 Tax=Heracleum sosnowskyi TaxID=360622 RepID=A0AAD8LYG0_9APIA|nr:UV-B-induced protein, chloroplastic-like [Heracleum sosnowskyi]
MDCCISYNNPSFKILPFTSSFITIPVVFPVNRKRVIVVASCRNSQVDFTSLNTPLEVKSPTGKFLSRVLQNDRNNFHHAVAGQLDHLVSERDEALARFSLSLGSSQASLYRRIAELKEQESQTAIEDVMYMLISYKFSEIRVHLVPRLSQCIYNGRLEIYPSKDWELESIHSLEVLEMIKEHLGAVIGWRADSSVTNNWATTNISKLRLCRIYAASILYGYFLKSASMRHRLELSLTDVNYDPRAKTGTRLSLSDFWSYGLNLAFGRVQNKHVTAVGEASCSQVKRHEKLSSYVMGFDPEVLQMCAKPKSREALNLIEKHSYALFGDEKSGLVEVDEVISTSLASQKRFVLEAVAFGSFLWDSEEYVGSAYKLIQN